MTGQIEAAKSANAGRDVLQRLCFELQDLHAVALELFYRPQSPRPPPSPFYAGPPLELQNC